MVLEERIPAHSESAAKEIVRYLKRENVPARIIIEPRTSVALILSGKYDALFSFLTACQEKHLRDQTGETYNEEPGEYNPAVWKSALDTLEAERRSISRIMEENNPGDLIAKTVHQVIFLKNLPESEYSSEEFAQELATVRTLISNTLCEITPEGFVLTKTVDPVDITLYIPYDYPFPPEQDVGDQYNITCIRHFRGEVGYVVQTGPEILFLDDIEAFVMFLSDNGVDSRSLMKITERCMSRLRITQEVINQVFDAGDTSLEDLRILFVDEIAATEGQGYVQDRFGLSPDYIDTLVADLRKLGMIKGRDDRLRPGNPSVNHTGKKGKKER